MWGCACAAAVAMTRPANAAAAQKKKRWIIDLLAKAPLRALFFFKQKTAYDITDCGGMEARNAISPTSESNTKSIPPRRRRRRAGRERLRMYHPDAAPPPRHGP